jgi:hypothetical protein
MMKHMCIHSHDYYFLPEFSFLNMLNGRMPLHVAKAIKLLSANSATKIGMIPGRNTIIRCHLCLRRLMLLMRIREIHKCYIN